LSPSIGGVFLTPGEIGFSKACSLHGAARTGDKALPGCVHFFDAADVGVKVTMQSRGAATVPNGVRVTDVEKGTPFAEASLQAEDVVIKVSGEDINDEHRRDLQFSRALRRKLAVGEGVALTVRRDDKVIEITVPPKD
jgi:S1-C subfamily serine protease